MSKTKNTTNTKLNAFSVEFHANAHQFDSDFVLLLEICLYFKIVDRKSV